MGFSTVQDLLTAPRQRVNFLKQQQNTVGVAPLYTRFVNGFSPFSATVPSSTNGEITDKFTQGALIFTNPSTGKSLYLSGFMANSWDQRVILWDLLWWNHGFSTDSTSVQNISTPPTLTRPDSSGSGVELFLWANSTIGSGSTPAANIYATYTNQDGVSGRTAFINKPTGQFGGRSMMEFCLQAGDTGVRTVSSVQLDTSLAASATFGLMLARRIVELPAILPAPMDAISLGLQKIDNDACVMITGIPNGSIFAAIAGYLEFVEG